MSIYANMTLDDLNERINSLYAAAVAISPLHAGQPKNGSTEQFNDILSEMADAKRQAIKILIAGGMRREYSRQN